MRIAWLALLIALPSAAQLPECGQQPSLVWFSPAKNAVDVPTDAIIMVLPTRDTAVKVLLDGDSLDLRGTTGLDAISFAPGPLEPDTLYTLVFEIGTGPTIKKVPAKFTTGAGPAGEAPLAPIIDSHQEVTAPVDGLCGAALGAQVCGEGTPEAWVRAALTGDPAAWVIERDGQSVVLPAECGAELVGNISEPATESACWNLSTLDSAGQQSETVLLCPFVAAEIETSSGGRRGGSSCTAGSHGAAGSTLLAIFLGILAVRRRLFIA